MVGRPRGELAELETALGTLQKSDRNRPEVNAHKRQVFQKMIGYMTVGMDMSRLMPKVISAANLSPHDLLLKKMMYLYLCTYARQNPDLALMAINQLQKDCRDTDPSVRGLALRSLCSLRVANLLEYVVDPILEGLKDRHPYVIRTAVMGVLKVHHMDPGVAQSRGLIDQVRSLMYESEDPAVLGNCLSVLTPMEGASKLANKELVYKWLNKIKEFSDYHQCQVLEVVAHYRAENESEVYDIMNVLEDRMTSGSSGLVLAVIKVFLFLTINMTATHQQVLERIREPLRMVVSRDNPAIAYTVLLHVLLLAQRAPIMFSQDYMNFYCRTDDPMYIKKIKLEILTVIADNSNAYDIVSELTEYVRDINPTLAREAVKAVGKVALAVPDVSGIVERLINFLESGDQDIVSETLVQMKDLLRRYPDMAEVCLPSLNETSPHGFTLPQAKAAFIWILGQHGDRIEDSPYILEAIAEDYAAEEPQVRLALLSAAAKLFFKRAPECQNLLGSVLAAGVNDENQDVHDRALLYYRLLKHDVKDAEKVISPTLPTVNEFAEEMTPEIKDKIFEEYNSLSVIYQTPAASFVDSDTAVFEEDELPPQPQTPQQRDVPIDSESTLLQQREETTDLLDIGEDVPSVSREPSATAGGGGGGLIDLDDLLSGAAAPAAPPPPPPVPSISLNPDVSLSPGNFQGFWRQFGVAAQFTETLSAATVAGLPANNHQDFCQHMKSASIHTMASGGDPSMYRYYFYGQPSGSSSWYLVEMIVTTANQDARVTVKCQDGQNVGPFVDLYKGRLAGFRN